MRLLLVYHAGATEPSRRLYAALGQELATDVSVVVPERIRVDNVYERTGWLTAKHDTEGNGYEIVPVPLRNPEHAWHGFETDALRRAIRRRAFDVVHVLDEAVSGYLIQTVWLARASASRARTLFYGFENIPFRTGRRRRLLWRATWWQMAGGAAASTEAITRVRDAGFPARRPIRRIFWGIPTDMFAPGDRASARRRLGLATEGPLVGYVGRLVAEKGLVDLLEALARLPKDVRCVFVGSGPLHGEIDARAAALGLSDRISVVGAAPTLDVADYLRALDALALPSRTTEKWKEQYGRVLAEAMAVGAPVVATTSGAIPEVVGDAGLLVPEADPAALAAALETAIADEPRRSSLVAAGRRRVEEELSTTAMARRLADLYRTVA